MVILKTVLEERLLCHFGGENYAKTRTCL